MSETPLYEGLLAHNRKNRTSFHTPGHKDGRFFYAQNLLSVDLTELPDTDTLYASSGIIARAEQAAARLYDVPATFFSAGGCSLCIQAMLRLVCPRGGKLLLGRNVHQSAVGALALLDIEPVWVLPRPDAGTGLPGRTDCRDVIQRLESEPDIRAVYLTTPDYYGCLTDLRVLGAYVKKKDIPLILDCAHGSHLAFTGTEFAEIRQYAAMAACSAHKTLPVLTGGAWLHVMEERFIPDVKQAMSLFGSTSPSYPIMASLDLARAWLAEEERKAEWAALQHRVRHVRELLARKGFWFPRGKMDPVRLTFSGADLGYTGHQLADWLREQGIEPEFSDRLWVVLIPTLMNSPADFTALETALESIPEKTPVPARDMSTETVLTQLPARIMTPKAALFSVRESVSLDQAAGRIAADVHCPCPPGVPVVMPGERIDETVMEILRQSGILRVTVL